MMPDLRSKGRDERGMALVGVLLLLMMMAALAAALTVSGITETLMARNHQFATQAQEAAEAGLSHAVAVVTGYILGHPVDEVLVHAADGNLDGLTTCTAGLDTCANEHALIPTNDVNYHDAKYYVEVVDDTNGEDADPLDDTNKVIVIRSMGLSGRPPNTTKVVLEAIVRPIKLPALLTGGDLTLTGNFSIRTTTSDPDLASVHSNANMAIGGGSGEIEGNGTASVSQNCNPSTCPQVMGDSGTAGTLPIPPARAEDHRWRADYVLETLGPDAGHLKCGRSSGCTVGATSYVVGQTICIGNACGAGGTNFGWIYSGGAWELTGNNPPLQPATFYVDGLPENAATKVSADITATIIAETSIDMSGSPTVLPNPGAEGLLFVTNGDLNLSGSPTLGALAQPGLIMVHEQVKITGGIDIFGQVLVEDAAMASSLVTSNQMSAANITYNGDVTTSLYEVSSWRDVRDDD